MIRIRSLDELRSWRGQFATDATVGFVPTMGALHVGHASLLHASVEQCSVSIASIFVNPLQFNEGADFKRYPRTEDEDCAFLESYGVQAVYLPEHLDIYPEGYETRVRSGPGGELYEGDHRPGHFEGMLTVVMKLLQRVQPTHAFFGQKDAQQLWLVRRMALDLDLQVEVHGCETVRESDGLAYSSRNAFLSEQQRTYASAVPQGVFAAQALFQSGVREVAQIERAFLDALQQYDAIDLEYAAVIDDSTFRPAVPGKAADWRLVVAVRIGETRLLDNIELGSVPASR